jgi:hypothetical protein
VIIIQTAVDSKNKYIYNYECKFLQKGVLFLNVVRNNEEFPLKKNMIKNFKNELTTKIKEIYTGFFTSQSLTADFSYKIKSFVVTNKVFHFF